MKRDQIDEFSVRAESLWKATGGADMGKLVVGTFVTVDGVMQAPGAPDEDREGNFEHGGWTVPFFDEALGEHMDEEVGRSDSILLGRKTYDIFVRHWPHVGDEDPVAAKLNSVQKYVASRTLDKADWQNTAVLGGELADEIPPLKERHGEVHVPGSADLIQSLLREDLVDEFSMLVFPVVLGSGKRLFGEGTIPRGMRLVETKTFPTGVVMHRYQRVGAPEYGTFGLETEISERAG
jgi:dihydrofolate reductase